MSLGFDVGDAILQFGDNEEVLVSGAEAPPFRFAANCLWFGFSSVSRVC